MCSHPHSHCYLDSNRNNPPHDARKEGGAHLTVQNCIPSSQNAIPTINDMRIDIKTDGIEVTQQMMERLDWICSKVKTNSGRRLLSSMVPARPIVQSRSLRAH